MTSIEDDSAGTFLTVDLTAIRSNWAQLQALCPNAMCGAVVKANAYGLGVRQVAAALFEAGCRRFFVADVDVGAALRGVLAQPAAHIMVLHGPPAGREADVVAHGLVPVLNSLQQVDAWARAARRFERPLPAFLQFDTGMSRLGLSPAESRVLRDEPVRLDGIELRQVMSHLACADEPEHPANQAQLERFRAILALYPGVPGSLANSSGVFLGADFHFGLVRPGAALYGIAPSSRGPNPMRPVVRLEASVIQVREVPENAFVGYATTWRARRPTRVATIAGGYADGLPFGLGNRGAAWRGGARLPIIGRVSMDSITLDVSELPADELVPGSRVELLGEQHRVDDLARSAGTIGYQVLTSLGPRHRRRYVGSGAVPAAGGRP